MSPFTILAESRDILLGRVDGSCPPAWAERRGFASFLLALDDQELGVAEERGLGSLAGDPRMPAALGALCHEVAAAIQLPHLDLGQRPLAALRGEEIHAVRARKQRQLPALLAGVELMAEHAARIVDVGAGSGHFTRVASDRFDRHALGIERDEARVDAATRANDDQGGRASFVVQDACAAPLDLRATDLAVGLHACGELGDRLVVAASEAGCDLALVSCCPQKITAAVRAPLSREARDADFVIPRDVLGLANLSQQRLGVEVSLEASLAAREVRVGLRVLLEERGIAVSEGDEMRGINRRRARGGLEAVARLALAARGLPNATAEELAHAAAEARRRAAIARRLSLPRNLLARVLEIAVVTDRAAALSERGLAGRIVVVFDEATTPRNVGLFASRDPARLPRLRP